MVVDRHRQRLLGGGLTDHIGVEEIENLPRLGQLIEGDLFTLVELLLDDLVAQVNAFVTDVDTWASNQLLDLLLTLPAKGTFEEVASVTDSCHGWPLLSASTALL